MKKFTILVLIVGFLAILYGCCSHSDNAVFVNPQGDSIITSRESVIDEKGRLPAVTFPSGAKIEALEENTLAPGIVVTVIEQKLTSKNTAYFNTNSYAGMTLYKITAYQKTSDLTENKTYVTTTEKPFRITLPNSRNSGGVTLVGIRESETDPWRCFSLSENDDVIADIAGAEVSESAPGEYSFDIFRLGTSFALITYEGNTGNRLPETFVSNLTASSSASILVKDGRYLEDLPLKGVLKGLNLESIKPTDLRARITYRNNSAEEAPIKINGARISQTNKADKTVPGYSYAHSFVVDNLSDSNIMNTNGEYEFLMNLSGIDTESFPSGFLIEFFDKVESEKNLPYSYTEFYTISLIESVNLVLASADGNIAEEVNSLYIWRPEFTVTSSYEFGEKDREKIARAISVSDVDSEKVTKTWNGRVLTLSFTENLLPSRAYTISIADLSDLENASINAFEDFRFTTIYQYCGYTVVHQQENIENSNYTVFEVENLSRIEDEEVTPEVKSYEGFDSPAPQTIMVASGTVNRVVYSYNRKVFNVTVNKTDGVDGVSGQGSYKYGADVVASCTFDEGYEFSCWDGDMNVATFTMPAYDVTMKAVARPKNYNIVYNNIESCTFNSPNPNFYNITSSTITLNNPNREGYLFIGWSGTGLAGSDTALVTIPSGSTGDREYTANWNIDLSFVIAPTPGNLIDENNMLFYTMASYTVTPNVSGGIILTDTDRANILDAIYVKDANDNILGDNIVQKSWQDGRIEISFLNDLNASTTYTIACGNVPNITIASTSSQVFKTFYYKGRGSSEVPYLVENAPQLDLVRNYLSYCFKQTEDISLASFNSWSPIGDETSQFTGTYDGDSKKITGLRISTDQEIYDAGLFGYNAGTLKNMVMEGFSIRGENESDLLNSKYIGVIIGRNIGSISDCTVKGNLSDSIINAYWVEDEYTYIGGICGRSVGGTISSCEVASISMQSKPAHSFIGGICGLSSSLDTVISCKVCNSLVKECRFGGGIGGYIELGSSIVSCDVQNYTGLSDSSNGGICGSTIGDGNCSITSCHVYNSSIKAGVYAGGICGQLRVESLDILSDCYVASSSLEGVYAAGGIGGIVGNSNITSCQVHNLIIKSNKNSGGIGGGLQQDSSVSNCNVYSSTIEAYERYAGGICGYIQNTGGSVNNCCVASSTINTLNDAAGICGGITKSNSFTSNRVEYSLIKGNDYVGGICSRIIDAGSTFSDCYIQNTTVQGNNYIGGICGQLATDTSFTNSYIKGSTVEGNNYVGGICGRTTYTDTAFSDCYILASSVKGNSYVGGVIGQLASGTTFSNSYVKNSAVEGISYIGGICGRTVANSGHHSDCYFQSSTVQGDSYVGGVCGQIASGSSFSSSYVYDSSVQGNSNAGGVCGQVANCGSLSNSYISNSTFTGGATYCGKICGRVVSGGSMSDCFTDDTGSIAGGGTPTKCYGEIGNFTAFSAKAWSDGLAYDNPNSVWKNYNISETTWPPDLKTLQRQ